MPLSTYAELQTAISDFLNRDDLTATVPTFIALAEAQLQRDVRHWRMENRADAQIDDRYTPLPEDWVETKRLTINCATGERSLRLMSLTDMQAQRERSMNTAGCPSGYAHTRGEIEVYPVPDGIYTGELYYIAKIPSLSDDNTSNWLLSEAPDAYLYGALMQSAPYLADDQRIAVWAGLYQAAIGGLNAAGEKAQHSGTGLRLSWSGN